MRGFLVFVFERDIAIEVQEIPTVECYKNSLTAAGHPQAARQYPALVSCLTINHDSSSDPYCSETVVKGALKAPFSYGLGTKMPSLISLHLLT